MNRAAGVGAAVVPVAPLGSAWLTNVADMPAGVQVGAVIGSVALAIIGCVRLYTRDALAHALAMKQVDNAHDLALRREDLAHERQMAMIERDQSPEANAETLLAAQGKASGEPPATSEAAIQAGPSAVPDNPDTAASAA